MKRMGNLTESQTDGVKAMKRLLLVAVLALLPHLVLAQWTDAYPSTEPETPLPREQVAGAPAVPAGQWVYTEQYGWVWMPYGDSYSYVPPDGQGEPYEYVYYPSSGWTWVGAPWIWGYGAWPYFGVYGPGRFGWYSHGWWRTPGRWHFNPSFRGGVQAARGGRGFVAQGRFRHFEGTNRLGGGARFAGGGRPSGGSHLAAVSHAGASTHSGGGGLSKGGARGGGSRGGGGRAGGHR
jgi:hypothetical protein